MHARTPPPTPTRMIARVLSASMRPSGNDLSHARNSGVTECAKCIEQVRERERAVNNESRVSDTCQIAQFVISVSNYGMLRVFSLLLLRKIMHNLWGWKKR